MRWNSRNKKYYINKGYEFSRMNEYFNVKVEDLPKGSNIKIEVECDYCKEINLISWYSYVMLKEREIIRKDCCKNKECTTLKSQDTLKLKYGTSNIRMIDGVNDKIASTNKTKYGCSNPFGNKDIQDKIKNTNIHKYGVPVPTQNKQVFMKYKQTCLNRYGVDNYSKTEKFKHDFSGKNSPLWKENPIHERTERQLPEYREWRRNVFQRDKYICQCCGAHNYKGNKCSIKLNAHHIYNFKDNKEKALDINNGITLCENCHIKFHSLYGKKNNTPLQLKEFINKSDEKVC